MPSTMQIGEVAALFDVTTKTLRHYEKLGLLQPERADNGYRLYGPEDVLRLQRIRQLQALGLSLKEIARLLADADELLWEEEQIRKDIERDIYMTPEEALAYGLVDGILENQQQTAKERAE